MTQRGKTTNSLHTPGNLRKHKAKESTPATAQGKACGRIPGLAFSSEFVLDPVMQWCNEHGIRMTGIRS